MRTIFTLSDIKNIIDTIFNGNLWASKRTNGKIVYNNPNSENIVLVDEDNGKQTEEHRILQVERPPCRSRRTNI